ncbi:hypothetical protein V8F06_012621 [Rhypophila decipiens]
MGFPHLPITLVLIGKAAASSPSGSLTAISQVPQATMTAMDIEQVMKCEFDTIMGLVNHVLSGNRTSYNVSFLIQTCPDVCGLVYGTGNPDISGVGAVVSYVIQGVSSLIFGPLLALFTLYLGSNRLQDSYFAYDPHQLGVANHFISVSKSIHQANIITAFAVLFAGVYRIANGSDIPTVGESELLSTLSTYQLLTCTVCTISYLPLHPTSRLAEKVVMGIYTFGTFFFWFSILFSGSEGYNSVVALKGIASRCIHKSIITPGIPQPVLFDNILIIPPVRKGINPGVHHAGPKMDHTIKWKWPLRSLWSMGVIYWICLHNVLLPLLGWILRELTRPLFRKLADILRVGPRRLGTLSAAIVLSIFFLVCVKPLVQSLFETREHIRSLAGESYEDNDWGFGQVTAVMTWVPVFQETGIAIFYTLRHYASQRKSMRRHHDAAEESSESLELLPSGQNSDYAENEGPGGTATPSVSPEDSESYSEPVTKSTDMPSRTPGTTSSQARPNAATLQPRGTWPRNESDTYLPLRA